MDIILRFNYWEDRNPLGAVIAYKYKKIGEKVETKLIEAKAFRSDDEKHLIIDNFKKDFKVLKVSKV